MSDSDNTIIIYGCVAHDKKILTSYSSYKGNFEQICISLLGHVEENTRATFEYADYLFFYWNINKLTYLIMTSKSFPKEVGSSFLESIKREFESTFPRIDLSKQDSFGLNDNFKDRLKSKMESFSSSDSSKMQEIGHIDQLKEGLIDMKNKVIEASDLLDARGEKLQLIVQKSEQLSENSVGFYRGAQKVRKKVFMQRIRMIILIILVALVVIYFVGGIFCGLPLYSKCFGSKN